MPDLIAHSEHDDKTEVRHFRRAQCVDKNYAHRMKLRIIDLRKKAGMTVEALADKAGLSKSYVSEIQTGKKQANARVLENLARALSCSVVDLIDESSTNPDILEHVRQLELLTEDQRETIMTLTRQLLSEES